MTLDPTTFEYLLPTDEQIEQMKVLRQAAKDYATILDNLLPAGVDKDHILRTHRSNAMWVNVAVTRYPNGMPRHNIDPRDPEPEKPLT